MQTRREWLGLAAAGLLADAQTPPLKLKVRTSKQIQASGISIGFETLDRKMFDPERTYEWIGQTGVKWARCQTGWARTEQRKGEFDFTWLDRVVDQLLDRGIQPWFNLGYGNKLYTPKAPHETAVGWAPVFDPEAMTAWKLYVGKLAEHFQGRVKHYEIWNEPNIPQFWQPSKPSAKDYVELVRSTAPVLREKAPGVTLIGGVLAGLGENITFAEQCAEAGLLQHLDKFSYHPYRSRLEAGYADDIRALRGLLRRYKDLPLWQGENGAPSEPKGFGALAELEWNEQAQASWLLRRLITDLSLNVELTSYFLIVDLANYVAAGGVDGRTNFKGVLRATDYKPKPSFYALQNLCTLFDSETKPSDHLLRCTRVTGGDEMVVQRHTFARRGTPIFAYWFASNLPDTFTPGKVDLFAWSGAAAELKNPILIDLRDGSISAVPNPERRPGAVIVKGVPLLDSPMLLTDASILGD